VIRGCPAIRAGVEYADAQRLGLHHDKPPEVRIGGKKKFGFRFHPL
jgi:hypothetical protein